MRNSREDSVRRDFFQLRFLRKYQSIMNILMRVTLGRKDMNLLKMNVIT